MILENHLAKIEVEVKYIKDLDITKLSKDSIILDPNNYLDENYSFKDILKIVIISVYLKEKNRKYSMYIYSDIYTNDDNIAILENNILTILRDYVISQFDIITGDLILNKEIKTQFPNFAIFRISNGYIIHNELYIYMLDFDFNIKWSFSGGDIFVSITNKKEFELTEDRIKLYDFNDRYYEIDFNGKLLRESVEK